MATLRERLDAWRSAPALEPGEGEQDERYDKRTDCVLDGDVSGARLEPREKRGKATHWNEPVHGGDGEEQNAKKSGDQGQGPFIGRMYARTANFPLRASVTTREDPRFFLAALAQLVRRRRKKDGGDQSIACRAPQRP